MIAIDQQVIHDPENGKYGDCLRACIASILELPSSDVPHFYEDGNEKIFDEKVSGFLGELGLALLNLNYFDLSIYPHATHGKTGIYHILSGYTERGTYHAVVGLDGSIVHDPHPSKAGLIGDKNEWQISFLVKI